MIFRAFKRGFTDSASYLGFPLWAWFCFAVLAFIKIWLVSGQALCALGWNIHDDMLFLNLANALIEGNWLGRYTQITLVKSPFYPLWIAAIHFLGIPLLLAQHLLYVTACIIFGISVRPLLRNTPVVILLFTAILFNPMSYADGPMTRVMREGIYPALTIFVIASAVGFLVRHSWSRKGLTSWSISLGLSLSAFWLTREESIWIMPFVIIVMCLAVLKIWWKTSVDWLKISLCALPFALWLMSIGTVASLNKIHYGAFSVVEFKSPEFLAAYGALTRVKHANWQPIIPVPSETREQIYKVSPAFDELRPFFEADIGGWSYAINNLREGMRKDPTLDKQIKKMLKRDSSQIWSTAFYNDSRNDRKELVGGCFLWTLRYAVAAAGYHTSGKTAADYYMRLSKEVDLACDEGRLSCLPERSSLMPPWHDDYASPFFRTMVNAFIYLVTFEDFTAKSSPSGGSRKSLMTVRNLTRERLSFSRFQDPKDEPSKTDDIKLEILSYIAKIYQLIMPTLFCLALLSYAITTTQILRNRAIQMLWALSTATLISILARSTILSLIHVTSFPAISILYLSPSYPLLLIFLVLAMVMGCWVVMHIRSEE